MLTKRLYYDDPYLREFEARVIGRGTVDGKPAVALDRTAFYPSGGGQPHDTGELMDSAGRSYPVVDVQSDEEYVWHVLGEEFAAGHGRGVVDWERRFDHMQQHTGQHILSQAFIVSVGAETVAFHLGEKASTIDLNRTDLDATALARAEAAANEIVDRALRVSAAYVTPEELAALPLRKPPKVTEDIRIVQVEGFDWSACGGTHVAYTSHIQLIKVVGVERRGPELRVTFLCGRRARADYSRLKALAQGLVARFTAAEDEILDLVDRRAAEADALRKDLAQLETEWAESKAAALYSEAPHFGDRRVIVAALDASADRVKKVAQALRSRSSVAVCLAARGERPQLIVTRSDDVAFDAGAALRTIAAAGGGKGGGRPDWAQGGVPSNDALELALEAGRAALAGGIQRT